MYFDFFHKIRSARNEEPSNKRINPLQDLLDAFGNRYLLRRRRIFSIDGKKSFTYSQKNRLELCHIDKDLRSNRNLHVITASVAFIVTSIGLIFALVFKYHIGWTFMACGIFLALSLSFMILSMKLQAERFRLQKRSSSKNKNQQTFKKSIPIIPPDPLMKRGITFLTYHGPDDCQKCREMRAKEEKFVKENIDPFGDHSGRHNSRIEKKEVQKKKGKSSRARVTKLTVGTK